MSELSDFLAATGAAINSQAIADQGAVLAELRPKSWLGLDALQRRLPGIPRQRLANALDELTAVGAAEERASFHGNLTWKRLRLTIR